MAHFHEFGSVSSYQRFFDGNELLANFSIRNRNEKFQLFSFEKRNEWKCISSKARKKDHQQSQSKHLEKRRKIVNFLHTKNQAFSRSKNVTQPFRFFDTVGMENSPSHSKVMKKKTTRAYTRRSHIMASTQRRVKSQHVLLLHIYYDLYA